MHKKGVKILSDAYRIPVEFPAELGGRLGVERGAHDLDEVALLVGRVNPSDLGRESWRNCKEQGTKRCIKQVLI